MIAVHCMRLAAILLAAGSICGCYQSHELASLPPPPPPARLHVPFDVNGDGYADVVVGAPSATTLTGRAFVYLGSGTGVGGAPATSLSSPEMADDIFGRWVAIAGDVNGDGYADVLVGGGYAAYLYLGSRAGVPASPSVVLTGADREAGGSGGTPVAGAGDVNGDGYADVVATGGSWRDGIRVYLGGAGGLDTTPSTSFFPADGDPTAGFESTLAGAGDGNGDGYADVVVRSSVGCSVYLGGAAGLSAMPSAMLVAPDGSACGDRSAIASAGDVNGDGYADVVIGTGLSGSDGRAYVYLGSASGIATSPATTLMDPGGFDGFGWSVAGAGDVNGDGYADVLVGAYDTFFSGAGRVYLYLGSAAGVVSPASLVLTGPDGAHGEFGQAVAGTGDVDGDGHPDIVVGAQQGGGVARATIYLGTGTGIAPIPATLLTDPDAVPTSLFGAAVAILRHRSSHGA